MPSKPATFTRDGWTAYAREHLIGRTIVAVDYMTKAETDEMGWVDSPVMLTLDNGTILFPMSDDEGNAAGVIVGQSKSESLHFPVIRD